MCKHRCLDKLKCKHRCCKGSNPPLERKRQPEESGAHTEHVQQNEIIFSKYLALQTVTDTLRNRVEQLERQVDQFKGLSERLALLEEQAAASAKKRKRSAAPVPTRGRGRHWKPVATGAAPPQIKLVQSPVNRQQPTFTASGVQLYGLDAQIYRKIKDKDDPERENRAVQWVLHMAGREKLHDGSAYGELKDGVSLCKALQVVQPGCIGRINSVTRSKGRNEYIERDNLTLANQALDSMTLPLFDVVEFHSKGLTSGLLTSIEALSQLRSDLPPL